MKEQLIQRKPDFEYECVCEEFGVSGSLDDEIAHEKF